MQNFEPSKLCCGNQLYLQRKLKTFCGVFGLLQKRGKIPQSVTKITRSSTVAITNDIKRAGYWCKICGVFMFPLAGRTKSQRNKTREMRYNRFVAGYLRHLFWQPIWKLQLGARQFFKHFPRMQTQPHLTLIFGYTKDNRMGEIMTKEAGMKKPSIFFTPACCLIKLFRL